MTFLRSKSHTVLFFCLVVVGCGPTHTPEEEARIAIKAYERESEKAMASDQIRMLQNSISIQRHKLMYAQSAPRSSNRSSGGLLGRFGGGGFGEAMVRNQFQQLGQGATQEIARLKFEIDQLVENECWKNFSAIEREYMKKHKPSLVPDGA